MTKNSDEYKHRDCTQCSFHDGQWAEGACLRFPPSYSHAKEAHIYPLVSKGDSWMMRACAEYKPITDEQ